MFNCPGSCWEKEAEKVNDENTETPNSQKIIVNRINGKWEHDDVEDSKEESGKESTQDARPIQKMKVKDNLENHNEQSPG